MGKCYNSITIPQPCDKVWSAVRNFHDMSWAPGVITSCTAVGTTPGDQTGAKRTLNAAIHETLLTLNDVDRVVTYSIDDGPGPLAKAGLKKYIGRLRVMPVTENNTSFVEWISTYESADDASVGTFCNPVYQALLAAMKKSLS